jgi:hypothetical protein
MTAMSALQDPFTSSATLTSLWGNSHGGTTIGGGLASVPCISTYASLQSGATYDLAGSYAFCELTPDQGGSNYVTTFLLTPDFTNGYAISYDGTGVGIGELNFGYVSGGSYSYLGGVTYSPSSMAWVKTVESGGTISFQTAPDGLTWTTQMTSPEPVSLLALYASISSGYSGAGTAGTTTVASFNIAPTTPAGVQPVVAPSPAAIQAAQWLGDPAMSDALYQIDTQGAVPLVAATAKTVLFVLAPAGHGIQLKKFSIGFDGVTATNVPALWEVNALTAAANSVPGTGNTSQTANIFQTSGRVIANSFTGGSACTVEPSAQSNVRANLLTPNGGLLMYDFPLGDEPDMPVSQGFCIRLTAPAVVNARCDMVVKRI